MKPLRNQHVSAKAAILCEIILQLILLLCENFRSCETKFGTRVPLRNTGTPNSQLRNGCEAIKRENPCFRSQSSIPQGISQLRNRFWHTSAISQHSDTPFAAAKRTANRKRVPREEPVPDPTSEPPRPKVVSPPAKLAPQKPPMRRCLTRSGGRSLQKKARVESSEPIDLTEQSPVPSPEPSPAPSPTLPAQPQELQSPLSEPQIPSRVAPEVIIKCPMLTQPPIEGNLDCRARPFHSELYFDTTSFQLRPELADSFRLLRRYHMEQLLAPRDFFYPKVRDPTLIHFTIDGRPGILGARHIAEALHIPYEPTHFEDFRLWTSPTELEMTQRRGVLLEALFKISEGYFFGPHHLIMATLLYFKEKVHKKKLQRVDAIPLLFPRLLCQILEHLGYPTDLQLERKCICREVFTLDKWNNMTAYRVEQPGRPQPAEIPAARRASPRHIPEGIPIASPVISRAPPVTPASSQPSSSAEPRMAIPISEYRDLAQEMAAIRACQEQMFATQAQHTAILRQIQHHLGIISPPEHSIPIPPEPSQAPPFVHQTMPPEEPTTGEAKAAEPSSPHHPPATI
uniref:Uncharacterized protein n=2 Tax=Vitis vinifera TaxID=29760 RepID=A5AEX2_VITVI|nr:hypothetical protein VITISV_014607 [Vitis vinifera]